MLRFTKLALGAAAFLAASAAYAADVKVTGLHACCGNCANVIKGILEKESATNIVTKTGAGAELTFVVPDAAAATKAVTALWNAGFAARVEGQMPPRQEGIRDLKGKELKVEGIHNCCGMCTAAINKALAAIGKTTAAPRQTTFTVTAETEIEARNLVRTLREAGFNAKIAK